ncbi:unnamed protein product [Polarella glacialis]|uniref:6-phosphofructo-2-kinase domain-containing protein n=1 Tax=Polarella glacialis TaxID=89957 RepID=A0A813DNS8_POLGL|nr:unnamed protein product [Polarella glacialis]
MPAPEGLCLAASAGLLGGLSLGYLFGRRQKKETESKDDLRPVRRRMEQQNPSSADDDRRFVPVRRHSADFDRPMRAMPIPRQISGGRPPPTQGIIKYTDMDGEESEIGRVYGLGGYSQSSRVLLCLVGLPARGKSYISKMLIRYLRWSGFPVKAFNAGNVRRSGGGAGANAKFFEDDEEATKVRECIADDCMAEALSWLQEHTAVCVAIFDATNTTIKRRKRILEKCEKTAGITPVFVESICDAEDVLERNYNLKLGNDDYKGMDPAVARADFLDRVKAYEKRYETIMDDEADGEISYIKLFNVGQKVVMTHCAGYLVSHIGFFLSNIHINPRCIWLTRHAESEDQLQGMLGSHRGQLTKNGKLYCRELSQFLKKCRREMGEAGPDESSEILVLMGTAPVHYSTLQRMIKGGADESAVESGDSSPSSPRAIASRCRVGRKNTKEFSAMSSSLLNELDAGVCNGLSYDNVRVNHPELWAERERDKLHFRYPNGESYQDVVGRLRPCASDAGRLKYLSS